MSGGKREPTTPRVWWIVVPVKAGASAKSRLGVPAGIDRGELAEALALDVIAAAVGTIGGGRVVVVTSSGSLSAALQSFSVHRVGDPRAGLDAAVSAGESYAVGHGADAVAALLGDVAAVTTGDLARALAAAEGTPRAFVPDHEGTGTALLTAILPARLRPAFGPGSARRHAAAGHVRLDLDLPRLRTDVDDADSLALALALGVGARLSGVLGVTR